METIRERSTFSQPKRSIDVDKICVKFEERNKIPFIDCMSALQYAPASPNDSVDIDCIKNISF